MEDLKRCPFCGGEPTVDRELLSSHWVYQVRCTQCFGSGPRINVKAKAIEAWNRRTEK